MQKKIGLILLVFLFPFCLTAQKKKRKKKQFPYQAKIQFGLIKDELFSTDYLGPNYLNLGLRKLDNKVEEFGLELIAFNKKELVYYPEFDVNARLQRKGFTAELFYYKALKEWTKEKWKIHIGPQFTAGFIQNTLEPDTILWVPVTYNDFKIGIGARLEANFSLNDQITLLAGTNLSLIDFGLRRKRLFTPVLSRKYGLDDFIQVNFIRKRYPIYFGLLFNLKKGKR